MPRQMFMDELWTKLKLIVKIDIYDKPFLRLSIEGIFYRLRVGCPWRNLADAIGNWNAINKQFKKWFFKEKLPGIFNRLAVEPD